MQELLAGSDALLQRERRRGIAEVRARALGEKARQLGIDDHLGDLLAADHVVDAERGGPELVRHAQADVAVLGRVERPVGLDERLLGAILLGHGEQRLRGHGGAERRLNERLVLAVEIVAIGHEERRPRDHPVEVVDRSARANRRHGQLHVGGIVGEEDALANVERVHHIRRRAGGVRAEAQHLVANSEIHVVRVEVHVRLARVHLERGLWVLAVEQPEEVARRRALLHRAVPHAHFSDRVPVIAEVRLRAEVHPALQLGHVLRERLAWPRLEVGVDEQLAAELARETEVRRRREIQQRNGLRRRQRLDARRDRPCIHVEARVFCHERDHACIERVGSGSGVFDRARVVHRLQRTGVEPGIRDHRGTGVDIRRAGREREREQRSDHPRSSPRSVNAVSGASAGATFPTESVLLRWVRMFSITDSVAMLRFARGSDLLTVYVFKSPCASK